jgi:hypothetical protein
MNRSLSIFISLSIYRPRGSPNAWEETYQKATG